MADERGFAFVETLVAAAIIAGMVGMMFESIRGLASRATAIEDRRQALLIAQSYLAAADASLTSSASGSEGRFRWHVEIARLNGEHAGLDHVRVSVTRADQALATLSTLRVAR